MDEATLLSDEDLIAAIRRGNDGEALEQLVARHLPQVRGTVFQLTLDDAAADDVTQEVFLRAIRGLSGFDGRAKFSTWLYRISRNTAHTWLEKHARRRSACPVESVEQAAADPAPDSGLLAEEMSADVHEALADLSPALRAAVVLTGLQGLSPAEAADIEGCSTATMYWRIHEARKQLRGRLQEYLS